MLAMEATSHENSLAMPVHWDLEGTSAQPLEPYSLMIKAAEQVVGCCTAYRLAAVNIIMTHDQSNHLAALI